MLVYDALWYVREPDGHLHGGYKKDLAYRQSNYLHDLGIESEIWEWSELVLRIFHGDEDAAQQAVFESMRERLAQK
jgi:hypothetical protein